MANGKPRKPRVVEQMYTISAEPTPYGDPAVHIGGGAESIMHPAPGPGYPTPRKYDAFDVIEDWELGFNLGSCINCIFRASRKSRVSDDLLEAMRHLERELNRKIKEEKEAEGRTK